MQLDLRFKFWPAQSGEGRTQMTTIIINCQKIWIAIIVALVFVAPVARSQNLKNGSILGGVLTEVVDIPMPGPAVRFDYQSLDAEHGRLYISHMNADQLVVFDTKARKVIENLDGFKRVHGVLAVPALNRVYASTTGDHSVASVDMETFKTTGTSGPINYPDGLAYSPGTNRVFVSDEHGGVDAVIDVASNKLLASIPLGGGAGNTVYDPGSGYILVAVHGKNDLVSIDPVSMKIISRSPLPGVMNPHGIALDLDSRLAYVAGEENHSLAVFDLRTMTLIDVQQVGEDPDVLAFDPGLKRLYISAESGTVSVLQEKNRSLRPLSQFVMPHAHTVAVDPTTHLVYFPLENVGGRPLLRIMKPSDHP
jgi:DNA-binding beta-propeller fold protein YncE